MKGILLCFFAATSFTSLSALTLISWTRETHLVIQNRRNVPVENIVVSNVDPHDFEEGSGPVEKFKGASIPAKRVIERRLEINAFASKCPLTMEFQFLGGEKGSFTINMKHAIGEGDADFKYDAPFSITYRISGNNVNIVLG